MAWLRPRLPQLWGSVGHLPGRLPGSNQNVSQINQKWYQYQKYRDLGRSANGLDDPNLDDALRPVRAAAVRQTFGP